LLVFVTLSRFQPERTLRSDTRSLGAASFDCGTCRAESLDLGPHPLSHFVIIQRQVGPLLCFGQMVLALALGAEVSMLGAGSYFSCRSRSATRPLSSSLILFNKQLILRLSIISWKTDLQPLQDPFNIARGRESEYLALALVLRAEPLTYLLQLHR